MTTNTARWRRCRVSEYDAWMSELRGLAAETRADRCAEARRFIKWLEENGKDELAAIAVADIDAYVRTHGASVRRTTCKGMTVKLRSLLRHLHLSGRTGRDLSTAVIGPTLYAFEEIPSALQTEDIKKVLQTTRRDRSPIGRRDYAILMLLTTYGLRAGEITTLRLEDIDWKSNVLRVRHSKTGAHSELPLLPGRAMPSLITCGVAGHTQRFVNCSCEVARRTEGSPRGRAYTRQ